MRKMTGFIKAGYVKWCLLYGKLRERARRSEFCVLIGYPSGQDGPILPARDCPFCSRNKISKSKRVHESFLLQNIFRGSKKIFCNFSVRMELENEKTESVNENENKENKTSLLHITGFLFSAQK